MTTEPRVTVRETDVSPGDGRVLHVYDTGPAGAGTAAARDARVPVFWLHGTPQIGAPPAPLFPVAAEHGVRWVSYDRPGYGGSSPVPDRDVASGAADVAVIADVLGLGRFAVLVMEASATHIVPGQGAPFASTRRTLPLFTQWIEAKARPVPTPLSCA